MSRRRRGGEGDEFGSLDLLLDTICNMFGMFIFIGMLVSLMASARSRLEFTNGNTESVLASISDTCPESSSVTACSVPL